MFAGARCALFSILLLSHPARIVSGFLLLLLCGSIVYSVLQIIAAMRYLAVCPPELDSAQPISILKPLAGLDLDLERNLRSFFEQDYAAFEILFAVRNENDPAVKVVEAL